MCQTCPLHMYVHDVTMETSLFGKYPIFRGLVRFSVCTYLCSRDCTLPGPAVSLVSYMSMHCTYVFIEGLSLLCSLMRDLESDCKCHCLLAGCPT